MTAIGLALALLVLTSGCTVPTQYHKSISVKKDASGKIIETIETEGITQHGQGYPLTFEHFGNITPQISYEEHDDDPEDVSAPY